MIRMFKVAAVVTSALFPLVVASGCYSHADADPIPVNFDIGFPSTAAAEWADGVKIVAYPAGTGSPLATGCLGAFTSVTAGTVPTGSTAQLSLTPCELLSLQTDSLPLTLGGDYYLVAIGSKGTTNVMAGCALESNWGNDAPLSVPMTLLIDVAQTVPTNSCSLATFCGNGQACP